MKLAGKTDVGRVRQDNQDDYRAGELPGDAAWLLGLPQAPFSASTITASASGAQAVVAALSR